MSGADAEQELRATEGRAPDVFRIGGWTPMRQYADADEVDFAIVGTGAGGGTLACRLAENGFSVVALDAGPYWRPLEDFASDEHSQSKLYWTDDRICDGSRTRCKWVRTIPASPSAAPPCILRWCRCGSARNGLRRAPRWAMARTGRSTGARMWTYYTQVEQALTISGPVTYPWGPCAAALPLSRASAQTPPLSRACPRGCEATGIAWDRDAARDRIGAPRRLPAMRLPRLLHFRMFDERQAERSHHVACRARIAAGAEIRDLAMVGRIETDAGGRACGVHYFRDGQWAYFKRPATSLSRVYAIETPRLLLMSANARFPRRSRQFVGPCRAQPHGARQSGGLGRDGR